MLNIADIANNVGSGGIGALPVAGVEQPAEAQRFGTADGTEATLAPPKIHRQFQIAGKFKYTTTERAEV